MTPSMFGTWAEKVDVEPTGNLCLALMKGNLTSLSTLFKDTKNPAAAWLCWYLAQKWQLPAPKPVADAINRFAEQIANLAIQALDGDARTVISGDVAGALWDTSPKDSKGDSRRGKTGLAEQLRLWERDIKIALRAYELREGGLPKEAAHKKVSEEMKIGIHSVDIIAQKFRNDFIAGDAEARAIAAEETALARARENKAR
jgi:hypothetical protein